MEPPGHNANGNAGRIFLSVYYKGLFDVCRMAPLPISGRAGWAFNRGASFIVSAGLEYHLNVVFFLWVLEQWSPRASFHLLLSFKFSQGRFHTFIPSPLRHLCPCICSLASLWMKTIAKPVGFIWPRVNHRRGDSQRGWCTGPVRWGIYSLNVTRRTPRNVIFQCFMDPKRVEGTLRA